MTQEHSPLPWMDRLAELNKIIFASGYGYALEMTRAIKTKAMGDPTYAATLERWLKTGSTIVLRDELCRPFAAASFVKLSEVPCPFHNMWEAMDSAIAKAKAVSA